MKGSNSPQGKKNKVVQQFFNADFGLIAAESPDDFEARAGEIDLNVFGDEQSYFFTMKKKIYEKNVLPRLNNPDLPIPIKPTTNVSESFNNMQKYVNEWRPHKLPILIERLEQIVKSSRGKMMCALYGRGDYQLAPSTAHMVMDFHKWNGLKPEGKDRKFNQFITMPKEETCDPKIQTSKNGCASIATPKQEKKPSEKNKRIRPSSKPSTYTAPKAKKAKKAEKWTVDGAMAAARAGLLDEYEEQFDM